MAPGGRFNVLAKILTVCLNVDRRAASRESDFRE